LGSDNRLAHVQNAELSPALAAMIYHPSGQPGLLFRICLRQEVRSGWTPGLWRTVERQFSRRPARGSRSDRLWLTCQEVATHRSARSPGLGRPTPRSELLLGGLRRQANG
jgi:hypothetical protein